jgi:hypothetical protein
MGRWGDGEMGIFPTFLILLINTRHSALHSLTPLLIYVRFYLRSHPASTLCLVRPPEGLGKSSEF